METEAMGNLKLSKNNKTNKSDKSLKIRLTDRDFEIFGFLLDQKFASLEQIYFRFFDARKAVTDPMPAGLHVTRQRQALEEAEARREHDEVRSKETAARELAYENEEKRELELEQEKQRKIKEKTTEVKGKYPWSSGFL